MARAITSRSIHQADADQRRVPHSGRRILLAQPEQEPPSWYKRIYLTLFLPLRRELFEDWFRIVLRYGRTGGEEHVLEPDPTDPLIEDNIKPTRGGQLYIFVNDAVIGVPPGLHGGLYKNNQGTGQRSNVTADAVG